MSLSHSPSIVTNGLILALDAANTKSYPGTGTAWNDLSSNNKNATLTNSPAYTSSGAGSYFTFLSASNQYAPISGSQTLSQATFIVWMYRSGSQADFAGVLYSRSAVASGVGFRTTSNEIGYTWNGDVSTYNWASGLTPPNLEWSMIAISIASSSATAYLCQGSGITSATNAVSHTSSTLDLLNLARDSFASTRCFNGRIGNIMLYDRALSSTEISQNYNALKSRYGL